MTITADRQKVLEFSDPYFMSGSLLLVPAASPIQGLADLAGKSVAVIEGAVQQHDLAQVATQAAQRSFETVHEALQALKTGQVDAFCQDDMLVLTLAQASSDLKAVGKSFVPRPYAVAVRKGETDFIGWINAALARMRSDGTYAALWQKYFGEIQTHLVKP
jgi:ABC-type amino acid transport substrate-binding protein